MPKAPERRHPNAPDKQSDQPSRTDGRPDATSQSTSDHGIVRDAQGQDQPADKSRAQHVNRTDQGNSPHADEKQ